MMLAALLLAGAVSLQMPYVYWTWESGPWVRGKLMPPPKYDHKPKMVRVIETTLWNIRGICGNGHHQGNFVDACIVFNVPPLCIIYTLRVGEFDEAGDEYGNRYAYRVTKQDQADTLRHEYGHCNGWTHIESWTNRTYR